MPRFTDFRSAPSSPSGPFTQSIQSAAQDSALEPQFPYRNGRYKATPDLEEYTNHPPQNLAMLCSKAQARKGLNRFHAWYSQRRQLFGRAKILEERLAHDNDG